VRRRRRGHARVLVRHRGVRDEERDLAAGEAAYEGLSRNLEKAAPGAAWATRLLDERRAAVEKLRQKAK
jgi:hypothetical protein